VTTEGKNHFGWIEIRLSPKKPALRVSMSTSLARVVPAVLSHVKALMDLSCNPTEVAEALGALAQHHPGMRVPGTFDGFELAVRAILGQQVTLATARAIAGRFAAALGDPIDTPFDALTMVFPNAARVADMAPRLIARLGMPGVRARAVVALARGVADGDLVLTPYTDVEATLERLRALPGVGEWTVQYITMRALAWPDAFLHTDLGVMKALGENDVCRVLEAGEAWRPWRAYAVMHLWNSVTKEGPCTTTTTIKAPAGACCWLPTTRR
jgi:AraC family transcriptional regulator of adaptative response / DNA-3-methyladenine glycosylase II